jgi:hypothetical protein
MTSVNVINNFTIKKGRFELTKVLRIERENDKDYTQKTIINNSISWKTGDFTQKTIKQLITKGEDARIKYLKRTTYSYMDQLVVLVR